MSKALKSIAIKHVSDLWLLTEVHYNQSEKKALQIKIKKVTWQTAGQKPSLHFAASILWGLLEKDNLQQPVFTVDSRCGQNVISCSVKNKVGMKG